MKMRFVNQSQCAISTTFANETRVVDTSALSISEATAKPDILPAETSAFASSSAFCIIQASSLIVFMPCLHVKICLRLLHLF